MITISQYMKISREDDEVAGSTEPSSQVEFDTTGDSEGAAAAVDPGVAVAATDELNDAVTESNEMVEQQANVADVHEELSEEVPVLEEKLESPETITPADAVVASESLKYKLKKLGIPLNNSKALSSVSKEDYVHSPAQVYSICVEDEKTLLQKTGEALRKAWEWIKKQFFKLVDLFKRVFTGVKSQAKNMIEELNSNGSRQVTVKQEDTIKAAALAPAPIVNKMLNSGNVMEDVGVFIGNAIKRFISASKKEEVKQDFLEAVNNTSKVYENGFKKYLDKAENKDFKIKAIFSVGDKYINIIFINVKDEDINIAYEKVPVEAPDSFTSKINTYDVIAALKASVTALETAEKRQDEIKAEMKKNPVEIKDSKIKTYLTNRWINKLAVTGCQDLNKYITGMIKCYLYLGRKILGKADETEPEDRPAIAALPGRK